MNTMTWPLRIAAESAEVKDTTLRQWFGIGVLKFRGDDIHSQGTGTHVRVSRLRAYEAAIVQELSLHGVNVSRGAKAAYEFTINGNAGRAAGQLFPVAKTVLVISKTAATVNNVDFSASVFDLSNGGVAIVVDLNAIVAKVDAVLNNSINSN